MGKWTKKNSDTITPPQCTNSPAVLPLVESPVFPQQFLLLQMRGAKESITGFLVDGKAYKNSLLSLVDIWCMQFHSYGDLRMFFNSLCQIPFSGFLFQEVFLTLLMLCTLHVTHYYILFKATSFFPIEVSIFLLLAKSKGLDHSVSNEFQTISSLTVMRPLNRKLSQPSPLDILDVLDSGLSAIKTFILIPDDCTTARILNNYP